MYFPEVTIGLSKENKSNILLKLLKIKKQEEKKMREISKEEMREVTAGRWKCHTCKKTYFLWIQLWSWASHGCVGFKYHWVF